MVVIGDGRMRSTVRKRTEMSRMKHPLVVISSLILMDVATIATTSRAVFFPVGNVPYKEEAYHVQAAMSVRISVTKAMTT